MDTFFRKMRGLELKQLGQAVGFPEGNADVRMAQYESGSRTPKTDITSRLAKVLDVSPQVLTVPDIDSYTGLLHTLFTLEDVCGLKVTKLDDQIVLRVDVQHGGMQLNYIKCSVRGKNSLQSWRLGRSPKRTMTAGGIIIPNWKPPNYGSRCCRRG